MSEFSECLNRIRINKNLYVIDLARLMNMDPSTISKWISGERKPRSRDVLDKLLGKMKLSDYDRKILIEAYEEELIGKENHMCMKLWNEIIHEVMNKKRDFSYFPIEFEKAIEEPPVTKKYNGKLELLQGIQNIFNYIIYKNIKKIYLRFDAFNPDVMLLLNLFVSKGYECEIELVIFPKNFVMEQKLFNLSMIKEIISLWANNATVKIYLSEGVDELNREENFIIADEFVLQYHQDLSGGFMSSEPSWINLWNVNFGNWKNMCRQIFTITSIGDIFGRYDYFITREHGFEAISYEYMPCLCPALNEDILRNDLLETIPDREQMIQNIIDMIIMSDDITNKKVPGCVTNYFSVKSIYDFMETGMFSLLPSKGFYKPLNEKERLTILENYLKMISDGKMKPFIIKDESGLVMKDINIEAVPGKNSYMRILLLDVDETFVSKSLDIRDSYVIESFIEYCKYLKECGYIISGKKTVHIIEDIFKEYKEKYNKKQNSL